MFTDFYNHWRLPFKNRIVFGGGGTHSGGDLFLHPNFIFLFYNIYRYSSYIVSFFKDFFLGGVWLSVAVEPFKICQTKIITTTKKTRTTTHTYFWPPLYYIVLMFLIFLGSHEIYLMCSWGMLRLTGKVGITLVTCIYIFPSGTF